MATRTEKQDSVARGLGLRYAQATRLRRRFDRTSPRYYNYAQYELEAREAQEECRIQEDIILALVSEAAFERIITVMEEYRDMVIAAYEYYDAIS